MRSTMSFLKRLGFEPAPVEQLESITEEEIDDITAACNEARFPIENKSPQDLFPFLRQRLSEQSVDHSETLVDFVLFNLQFAENYEEFKKNTKNGIETLDSKHAARVVAKFLESLTLLPDYFEHRRLNSYKTRANNYYMGMEYTCNLRGRFSSDYNYRTTQIEQYKPSVKDVVPMVALAFNLSDSHDRTTCMFDVEEKELDEIIANLLAAQKELKALHDHHNQRAEAER